MNKVSPLEAGIAVVVVTLVAIVGGRTTVVLASCRYSSCGN